MSKIGLGLRIAAWKRRMGVAHSKLNRLASFLLVAAAGSTQALAQTSEEDFSPHSKYLDSQPDPMVAAFGYLDLTFTVPLQDRPLAQPPPPGLGGEINTLPERAVITTLEVDVPISRRWRFVVRPALYNTQVLDPLLGVNYERTLASGLEINALQSFTLPVMTLSRESGRVTSLGESLRLSYEHKRWTPYLQLDGSYSWFSNQWLAIAGKNSPAPVAANPVPVDQDVEAFTLGCQRSVHGDRWLFGAYASAEHLHFHVHDVFPAVWATTLAPLSITLTPVPGTYLDVSLLITQQAKLIIWPDSPILSFGGGVYF